MTIVEILGRLKERGKTLTKQGLYNHIKHLKLKPLGVGRPAIYADDAADKIMQRLGVKPSNGKKRGVKC
jgi:hypothetical protein